MEGETTFRYLDEGLIGLLFTFQLKNLHMLESLYHIHLDTIRVYYFQYLPAAYCMLNTLLAGCFLNELIIHFRDSAMDII